jgi:hypothetical protein
VYSSGPYWGRIVDTRGPRILQICAFILLLSGYSGIQYIFDSGVPSGATTISTFTFCLLVLCGYMTGSGGNGGLTSSVNSTARTFPDKAVSYPHLSGHDLNSKSSFTAWFSNRNRNIGIWPVGFSFLFHIAHCIRREHIIVLTAPRVWDVNTDGAGLLFRASYPTAPD